jgi:hypothetical protein
MLLTMIEVVSCENPRCKEFARIAPNPHRLRSYYCPVCGRVSTLRVVEIKVAESPERFAAYLTERIGAAEDNPARRPYAKAPGETSWGDPCRSR